MGRHGHHHRHHHKKKKNMWTWVIVIVILAGIVYAYDIGGVKTSISNTIANGSSWGENTNSWDTLPKDIFPKVLIKDLNQNPETYIGKNISISGVLDARIGGYSLKDTNGRWVWIGEAGLGKSCIEPQREYSKSKIYTAKGTFFNRFICSEFLE